VSVWIYSTEEGLRRGCSARERERGRKGVRKRLPLRQMCAAKAADVDAYAAGRLAPSAAAKGASLALITLFLFSAHIHARSNATTASPNYQLLAICIFIVCV
jgi:hypothetical protein